MYTGPYELVAVVIGFLTQEKVHIFKKEAKFSADK